jgi:hypothetical protein
MIPASRRADAAAALRRIGLRQEGSVESEFVSYEASFRCAESSGNHTLDLHWRIHYSQMQAQLLPFEELRAHAKGLAAFDNLALAPSRAHSMLITCLHRANDLHYPLWHNGEVHFGTDRLVWLHDLHLLLGQMSDEEAMQFARAATTKGLWAVCADALLLAIEAFGTRPPAPIASLLATRVTTDPLRTYHGASTLLQKWTDIRALPGWRDRARFTLDHLLPPPGYMRGRYRDDDAPLQVLHARRIIDALRRRSSAPAP